MPEITTITEKQSLRLEILKLVEYDETAGAKAIAFVADDELRAKLFSDAYVHAYQEPTPNAKAEVAITKATKRLAIINS